MSKLLLEKYKKVKNEELNKILSKIKKEPVFLGEKRLLSEEEVINFKNELGIDDNNIIILLDCYDNNYLVFDMIDNCFKIYNIDDNLIYNSKFIETILKDII